jgi:hypothetical protein
MKDMTHETRHHRPGLFRPDLSSTLNSLPGRSHPRYQPSTPQPSCGTSPKNGTGHGTGSTSQNPCRYWLGTLVRVFTPVRPPPGSLLSTINFRLSTPPHLTKTEQNGLKRTSISTTPPGKLEQASASAGKRRQASASVGKRRQASASVGKRRQASASEKPFSSRRHIRPNQTKSS